MKKIIKILYIDDNPMDIALVRDSLEKEHGGFELTEAKSQKEFQKLIQKEAFDLVLTDFNILGYEGLQVLDYIKTNFPKIPVIIVTGTGTEEAAVGAIKRGASDYLIKSPSHIKRLPNAILIALKAKQMEEERLLKEEIIKITYERLKLSQRASKSGTWDWDIKNNLFYWAEEFLELFGMDADTEPGFEAWKQSLHPDDIESAQKAIQDAIDEKKELINDYRIILKNNDIKWIRAIGNTYYENDKPARMLGLCMDITEHKNAELRQKLFSQVLEKLNRPNNLINLIADIFKLIKDFSGLDAVAIRLKDEDDYPYYGHNDFHDNVNEKEKYLFSRELKDQLVLDDTGAPIFECMCGKVINGKTDPSKKYFTKNGSFWTNSISIFLEETTEKDCKESTCNRCHDEGFESVALIPVRSDDQIIGLMQLNDKRVGRFTLDLVEFFEGVANSIGIAMNRVKTQEKIRESEKKFHDFFEDDLTGDFISTIDGKIEDCNPAFAKILGYKFVDEALNNNMQSHYNDPEERKKIIELLKEKGKVENYELDFIHRDGSIKRIIHNAIGIYNSKKELTHIKGYLFDITDRKKAENSLLESMKNYQELIDGMNETVWIIDFNGDLIDVNKTAVKNLGYTKEELLSIGLYGINSSLEKESIIALAKKMPEDSIQIFETSHKTKDGNVFPVEVYSSIVNYQGKRAILSIARDITERKKAGELINQERKLLRTLIDNLPDAIYVKDKEGRKLAANVTDMKIMNCASETDFIGKTDIEIFNNENGTKGFSEDMWVLQTGQSILNKIDFYSSVDGSEHWRITSKLPLINEHGQTIGLVGIGRDITEQKKAEEKLAREQYLMQSLLENIPDSIYFKDLESRFIRINKAMAKLFGFEDPLKLLGRTDKDFFASEFSQQSYNDEQEIIKTGNSIIDKEELQTWPDRIPRWVSTTKMPLKDTNGNIIGTFGISRDITEQKQFEKELIIAKEKAEESDHLKTAFLHNISHEIRTPMNAIVGFSDCLKNPDLLPEKQKYYTEIIIQSSNQLLSIISDIIAIATIEAGQEKINETEINLNSTCKILYQQFLLKAKKQNISLNLFPDLPDSEAVIRTDETKIVQILSNLIGNALKFTKQGSIDFGYSLKEKNLEFYVKDTGIGIPPEMHTEIFKRFRQVETTAARQYGGSGLGLSISKAYVELLGGKMWLISKPGKGSIFYFTIPYIKGVANTYISDKISNGLEPEMDKYITLLIAEDDDYNFMFLEELLSGMKLHILRAINGVEAVENCKSNQNIDLVLMDIKMPEMDGYEATKRIKEFRPDLPIIAQTAYSSELDRNKALICGCSDFISKPYGRDLLLSKINEQIIK